MLRSVGALISGSISDRYGRKFVMIGNLVAFIALELASGFTTNLSQLLGVRALYGIAMGVSARLDDLREVELTRPGTVGSRCSDSVGGLAVRCSR